MKLEEKYFQIKKELQEEVKKLNFLSQANHLDESKKSVTLVAVSKTYESETIRDLYKLGQLNFAENYVNEFLEKSKQLQDLPLKWHFIGHLQTNKVDKIVGHVELIQSVDSERLLKKISEQSLKKLITQNILLQVKFGEEPTKYGFDIKEIDSIIETYKNESSLNILGLMCILPLGISDEQKKQYFRELSSELLKLKLKYNLDSSFNILSMGMSNDFKLAISEGSTMIRIGSAIFGARS